MRKVWLLVPARGGSKGIPRKNLKKLGHKPLILHILQEVNSLFPKEQVIVSTDDSEIANVSSPYARIHDRSQQLADDKSTLDEVALSVAEWLIETAVATPQDFFITLQPTSPFLLAKTIKTAVSQLENGANSVLSVKDDRHLRWTVDSEGNPQPLYEARVNRQWMPATLAETGGIIGTSIAQLLETKTRLNPPIALVELSAQEGLDIDDHADWAVAEFYLRRKRILIRADAGESLGMGHVYRAIALAHELNEHNLLIVSRTDGGYQLGYDFLTLHPYRVKSIDSGEAFLQLTAEFQPHLTILDILDTDLDYTRAIQSLTEKLVCLENLGEGATLADIVINDLYTDIYPQKNHWYGVANAILSPQFETVHPRLELSNDVENLLVAFGGTDPQNLTQKALTAIADSGYQGEVTVVLGPGYSHGEVCLEEYGINGRLLRSVQNMAILMREMDLAITSAGRTVTELMTLGIPTLVMCQNMRELTHTHASSPFGVINLGLGEHVAVSTLSKNIHLLLEDTQLRLRMRERALRAVQSRSNHHIVTRILDIVGETK